MSDQFRVVCATCQVGPEVITNDQGETEAICPICGQRDEAEDAIAIAQEHLQYEAQIAFQNGLGNAVQGREFIRFTPEPIPPRAFKWRATSI